MYSEINLTILKRAKKFKPIIAISLQPTCIYTPRDLRYILEIKSIGSLNPSEMVKPISDFVYEKMGIPVDRIYISFQDVPASLCAWNGRTFG